MKKYLLYLLTIGLLTSCNDYKYPEDKSISESSGAMLDSAASYLPDEVEFAGVKHNFDWDSKTKEIVDSYYRMTSEPVLYNFYLGRQMYRFLLEKEGKSPLIITINIEGKKSWVVSKKIQEREQIAPACGIEVVTEFDHYTRELSAENIATFENIVNKTDLYHLSSPDVAKRLTSYCLIETHSKGKYWVAYRSLDDVQLKELVDFVVGLTRFNYDMEKRIALPTNIILG